MALSKKWLDSSRSLFFAVHFFDIPYLENISRCSLSLSFPLSWLSTNFHSLLTPCPLSLFLSSPSISMSNFLTLLTPNRITTLSLSLFSVCLSFSSPREQMGRNYLHTYPIPGSNNWLFRSIPLFLCTPPFSLSAGVEIFMSGRRRNKSNKY